jgi:transposase
VHAASERLTPTDQAAGTAVLHAAVAHFDESGMRLAGTLHGLHVATRATAVYDTTHPHRGQAGMDAAGLLPAFAGCAVHDHWQSYWHDPNATHALCNAHHVRERRYLEELTGHHWPIALRHLLVEGKRAVSAAQAAGHTALAPACVEDLLTRDDQRVSNGLALSPVIGSQPGQKGRAKQHPATNLLRRLRGCKTEVWRFLTNWHVPFDNNRAERMVRPVKVKLKVIGGFRAGGGAKAFCVIRSVWETSQLNGQNPFETLRMAFTG